MKKYIVLSLFCVTALVCNERVEVQSHITYKGKPVGISTIFINSDDTIQNLTTHIKKDLINSGLISATAQPQQNKFTLSKIEAGSYSLMTPALQTKKVANTLLPPKKRSLFKSFKQLYEVAPEPLIILKIELT